MALTDQDMYQIRETTRKMVKDEICTETHRESKQILSEIKRLSEKQTDLDGRMRVVEQNYMEDMKFIKEAVSRPGLTSEAAPVTKMDNIMVITSAIGQIFNTLAGSAVIMLIIVILGIGPKEVIAMMKTIL